jgi:hypothetical protein
VNLPPRERLQLSASAASFECGDDQVMKERIRLLEQTLFLTWQ